jgi:hypothetical protein
MYKIKSLIIQAFFYFLFFYSILTTPRIGIKASQVNIDNESCVSIALPNKGNQTLNHWINIYMQNLQKVIIKVVAI